MSWREWFRRGRGSRRKREKSVEPTDRPGRSRPQEDARAAVTEQPVRVSKRRQGVWVGLDFGTSTTKMAFSPLGRRQVRPLLFGHGLDDYPDFCIPSVACIARGGKLLFGIDAADALQGQAWDSGIRNLKMLVAGRHESRFRNELDEQAFAAHMRAASAPDDLTPERITTIFLADSMSHARRLLEHDETFRDSELDLRFNICVPIDHIEVMGVHEAFDEIARHAELLEREWPEADAGFDPLKKLLDIERREVRIDESERRVSLVPESVAEVASYTSSQKAQRGIHCVVDIGAGTTDVSIFNLGMPSGGVKTQWFSSRALPWGVSHVEHRVVREVLKNPKSWRRLQESMSGRGRKRPGREIREILVTEFKTLRDSAGYRQAWKAGYRRLKKASDWERRPLFLCGGGSELWGVRRALKVPWWENLRGEHRVQRLPTPVDYHSADGAAPFHRMEVAYGLTIPKPMLDQFVLPGDVADDLTPPAIPEIPREWDQDLYAK